MMTKLLLRDLDAVVTPRNADMIDEPSTLDTALTMALPTLVNHLGKFWGVALSEARVCALCRHVLMHAVASAA